MTLKIQQKKDVVIHGYFQSQKYFALPIHQHQIFQCRASPIFLKIAHKFTSLEEYKTIPNAAALIRKLTIVWGAKESLYKIYGKKKLLFLHHIHITDFKFEDKKTTGEIRYDGTSKAYQIQFLEFEDFTCVFAY